MAVEAKRGCGYRKVGGLYMMGGKLGAPCCKLPILLQVCPTCGGGVKQKRGWTWIDPRPWLKGDCLASIAEMPFCPAANPNVLGDRVGLLWIGAGFYPTPESFIRESNEQGISRRIHAIPRGFKIGESWVFLAHPKVQRVVDAETGVESWIGGVFRIFKPDRIEKIVTQSESANAEEMEKLREAGITPFVVPDDDKDHQGSVYDEDEEPGLELNGGSNGHEHGAHP